MSKREVEKKNASNTEFYLRLVSAGSGIEQRMSIVRTILNNSNANRLNHVKGKMGSDVAERTNVKNKRFIN